VIRLEACRTPAHAAASHLLKLSLSTSLEVEELAQRFIMVNLEDDEEPAGPEWAPVSMDSNLAHDHLSCSQLALQDGHYYPRVLFGRSSGGLEQQTHNKHTPSQHMHFYANAVELAAGMEHALEVMGLLDEAVGLAADHGVPSGRGKGKGKGKEEL